ncbi:MAG TPA: hypothetical protein VFM14_09055 [Gemmatimonadales bacterium]|nr:hypothetical protein [Gemmatimonadales bacterium]
MALQTVRPPTQDPREPTQHLLDPVRVAGQTIQLSLTVRRDSDGVWRGRFHFADPYDPARALSTAEIFCSDSEAELWLAVHRLRDHHIRDLFRSLDSAAP